MNANLDGMSFPKSHSKTPFLIPGSYSSYIMSFSFSEEYIDEYERYRGEYECYIISVN